MSSYQSIIVPGVLLIFSGAFIIMWATFLRQYFLLFLGIGYALYGIAFAIFILGQELPKTVLVLLINGAFLLAVLAMVEGLALRRGKPFGLSVLALMFVLIFAACCVVFFAGAVVLRPFILSMGVVIILFATFLRIKPARSENIFEQIIYWTVAIILITNAIRSFLFFFMTDVANPGSLYWQVLQLYVLFLAMILALEVMACCFAEALQHSKNLRNSDHLSGVLSRSGFEYEVELSRRNTSHRSQCLLVLDLDGFKAINDTYGHPVGDQVLRAVGEVLRRHARAADAVGRMGGDEFAIFAKGMSEEDALSMAERVRRQLEDFSLTNANKDIVISCSIGIVSVKSGTDMEFESLYRLADMALYDAKHAGRNRVQLKRIGDVAAGQPLMMQNSTS